MSYFVIGRLTDENCVILSTNFFYFMFSCFLQQIETLKEDFALLKATLGLPDIEDRVTEHSKIRDVKNAAWRRKMKVRQQMEHLLAEEQQGETAELGDPEESKNKLANSRMRNAAFINAYVNPAYKNTDTELTNKKSVAHSSLKSKAGMTINSDDRTKVNTSPRDKSSVDYNSSDKPDGNANLKEKTDLNTNLPDNSDVDVYKANPSANFKGSYQFFMNQLSDDEMNLLYTAYYYDFLVFDYDPLKGLV